jgi:hypothetical protein
MNFDDPAVSFPTVSKQKEIDILNLGIFNARKFGFGSHGTDGYAR